MSERPIAYLDSGVGGVPYLLACRARLPHDRFIYYADNAHFPYGERDAEELRSIVVEAAGRLIELEQPRLIVVACNTASVVALDALREHYEVPFVGVVPAIKPAAEEVGEGSIGVLATSRTVEDPYVSMLIKRFARHNRVRLVAASGLVQLVEEGLGAIDTRELTGVLRGPVRELREARVSAVVLGCTHFMHVREAIQELLGPEIRIVDSVAGVTRQTVRLAGGDGSPGSVTPGSVAPRSAAAGSVTPGSACHEGENPATTRLLVSSMERAGASYHHLAAVHGFTLSEFHAGYRTHR